MAPLQIFEDSLSKLVVGETHCPCLSFQVLAMVVRPFKSVPFCCWSNAARRLFTCCLSPELPRVPAQSCSRSRDRLDTWLHEPALGTSHKAKSAHLYMPSWHVQLYSATFRLKHYSRRAQIFLQNCHKEPVISAANEAVHYQI